MADAPSGRWPAAPLTDARQAVDATELLSIDRLGSGLRARRFVSMLSRCARRVCESHRIRGGFDPRARPACAACVRPTPSDAFEEFHNVQRQTPNDPATADGRRRPRSRLRERRVGGLASAGHLARGRCLRRQGRVPGAGHGYAGNQSCGASTCRGTAGTNAGDPYGKVTGGASNPTRMNSTILTSTM